MPELGELGQQTKLGIKTETLDTEQPSVFQVLVDLGVRVLNLTDQTDAEPVALYQIEAIFQVDYEMTGSVEQTALEEFAHYDAVDNVWPFWRQYVFSIANQAGLPCPEVPLNTSLQNFENDCQNFV